MTVTCLLLAYWTGASWTVTTAKVRKELSSKDPDSRGHLSAGTRALTQVTWNWTGTRIRAWCGEGLQRPGSTVRWGPCGKNIALCPRPSKHQHQGPLSLNSGESVVAREPESQAGAKAGRGVVHPPAKDPPPCSGRIVNLLEHGNWKILCRWLSIFIPLAVGRDINTNFKGFTIWHSFNCVYFEHFPHQNRCLKWINLI